MRVVSQTVIQGVSKKNLQIIKHAKAINCLSYCKSENIHYFLQNSRSISSRDLNFKYRVS